MIPIPDCRHNYIVVFGLSRVAVLEVAISSLLYFFLKPLEGFFLVWMILLDALEYSVFFILFRLASFLFVHHPADCFLFSAVVTRSLDVKT